MVQASTRSIENLLTAEMGSEVVPVGVSIRERQLLGDLPAAEISMAKTISPTILSHSLRWKASSSATRPTQLLVEETPLDVRNHLCERIE